MFKPEDPITLIPVLAAFQKRHGITDMVVVADAGIPPAGNLNALEDVGFSFIVGSRLAKAPYGLAEHFEQPGDYFTDGQILDPSGDGDAQPPGTAGSCISGSSNPTSTTVPATP